ARGPARPGSAGRALPACGSCRTRQRPASGRRGARHVPSRAPRRAPREERRPARELRRESRRLAAAAAGWPTSRSLRLLGLFVDDLVVGFLDNLVVRGTDSVAARGRGRRLLCLYLLVDGLGELVRGLHELLALRPDLCGVVAVERLLDLLEPRLDRGHGVRVD